MAGTFWEKAAKFVAKGAVRDVGYAEMASEVVGKAGEFVYEGAKGAIKQHQYREGATMVDKLFESPLGYDIKTRYALGIGGAILAPAVLDTGMQIHNRNKMGDISGGELANQVNPSSSPILEDEEAMAEAGERNLGKRILNRNVNTYGAEGDIVLALHNLRRG